MSALLLLYFEFLKIGLFAVGGGLATLPFLYDLESKYTWLTAAMIGDMVAISESTPGPMGVNMATYVGFQNSGVIGSVIATLGLITPSIIIIIIIANILVKFKESKIVKNVFYTLRPAATGLIASAGLSVIMLAIFKTNITAFTFSKFDFKCLLLFIFMIIFTWKTKFHPIVAIAISGAIGILFSF
ncbi:MAG: chromate transporter [Clostridia bacterium]|jgi:chromate transporter|nr:chromate transporter [Clostridia bacterium]MCI1999185.1 chromate transporter [Clostridia bacterium]MCI2014862.1 chromate transporter [Clostridia bacterium]